MRNAHVHAAVAKIRSLARLERQLAVGQRVSELAYAEMLHEEYSSEAGFRDLSFTTIAAAGPNGAIVHYSQASPDVALRNGELFLVDSGVQVLGGTTDDTRTVSIGSTRASGSCSAGSRLRVLTPRCAGRPRPRRSRTGRSVGVRTECSCLQLTEGRPWLPLC